MKKLINCCGIKAKTNCFITDSWTAGFVLIYGFLNEFINLMKIFSRILKNIIYKNNYFKISNSGNSLDRIDLDLSLKQSKAVIWLPLNEFFCFSKSRKAF